MLKSSSTTAAKLSWARRLASPRFRNQQLVAPYPARLRPPEAAVSRPLASPYQILHYQQALAPFQAPAMAQVLPPAWVRIQAPAPPPVPTSAVAAAQTWLPEPAYSLLQQICQVQNLPVRPTMPSHCLPAMSRPSYRRPVHPC